MTQMSIDSLEPYVWDQSSYRSGQTRGKAVRIIKRFPENRRKLKTQKAAIAIKESQILPHQRAKKKCLRGRTSKRKSMDQRSCLREPAKN